MYKILLVGAGHMGSALLSGWINSKIKNITVIDPIKKKNFSNVKFYQNLSKIKNLKDFDIIFFAVTPQIINKAIKPYKLLDLKGKLVISIIAGKKINFFTKELGKNVKIIRAMPNLPALVGKGVTCLYTRNKIDLKIKRYVEKLFKSVGKTYWLNNEKNIDKITAVSGSGPAYYFYFIEGLARAGKNIGLNRDFAYELSKETAIGAIRLLEKSNQNAGFLRKKIAIKGGTTEAGINTLRKNLNMHKVINQGVQSAFNRSIELGKKKKKK